MKTITMMILMALAWTAVGLADEIQTDWSAGSGETGPVPVWENTFDINTDISWLSIPGQLSLSSSALPVATNTIIAIAQNGAFGVEIADLDGDGNQDIIGTTETADKLTVWYNDGAQPPAFTAQIVASGFNLISGVFSVDLDGDLDLDIIACSGEVNGRVTCYLNNGGSPVSWSAQNVDTNWGEAWEIAAGDIDSDGNMDIIGTSMTGDSVVWWRNDGMSPISWSRKSVDAAVDGAHSVRAKDIDGDGNIDLVGCGTTSRQVDWWKNGGDDPITWTKYNIDNSFTGWRSVRIGDIDNDGDQDVCASSWNRRVEWWSNDGGDPIVWTPQIIDLTLANVHQIQVADMNGDGRLDIIGSSYGGSTIAWWENGGGSNPITWTKWQSSMTITRPLALDVGDLDGDGTLEIVGSSNTWGWFQWFDALSFDAAGSLTSPILDSGLDALDKIDWTATTPPGTSLHFQVRSGTSIGTMGAWSADITTPGALDSSLDRYLQYRVFMSTSDTSVSPILKDVGFSATTSAILPGTSGLSLTTYPNPANPRANIAFELPVAGHVQLQIFDLRGRQIQMLSDASFNAGPNEVAWDGTDFQGRAMATGTYYVQLNTEHGMQHSRITLVR
jgi:hypothetical protein